MPLLDQIKARMFAAMKSGNVTEREILKVAMGEITTDAARAGRKGDDDEAQAILKKLVKSNEETIEASQDETQKTQLRAEIAVACRLLAQVAGRGRNRGSARPGRRCRQGCGQRRSGHRRRHETLEIPWVPSSMARMFRQRFVNCADSSEVGLGPHRYETAKLS